MEGRSAECSSRVRCAAFFFLFLNRISGRVYGLCTLDIFYIVDFAVRVGLIFGRAGFV